MDRQPRDGAAGRVMGPDGPPQLSVIQCASADCCAGGMLRFLLWVPSVHLMQMDFNSLSQCGITLLAVSRGVAPPG